MTLLVKLKSALAIGWAWQHVLEKIQEMACQKVELTG